MAQGTIPKPSRDLSELVQLITELNNGELDAMTLLEMKTLLVSYGFAEPKYMFDLNLVRVSHVSFVDSQPVVILKGGTSIKFGASTLGAIDTSMPKPDPVKMAAALDVADALFADEVSRLEALTK
jgi:hypothetical protein